MADKGDDQDKKSFLYTQKLAFAEDLVSYILKKNSMPGRFFRAESQKKNGASKFDYNLRMATDFLYNTFGFKTDQSYNIIMANNLNNIPWFDYYAYTLRTNFIGSAFYTESFFHYAVHLAHLATKLYARGFKEAPGMAVNFIVDALDLDMLSSGRSILDLAAKEYEETQRQSFYKCYQPSSLNNKEESFVPASDVQICVPHEHLRQCKATAENFKRQKFTGEKTPKCREDQHHVHNKQDQHHVYNKQTFNNNKIEKGATSSSSLSYLSQSYSGFEQMRTFKPDLHSRNPCNMSAAADYVGVPGLHCEESNDSNDVKIDENKSSISSFSSLQPPSYSEFKQMRAFVSDPRSRNPRNMSSPDYSGVPGSHHGESDDPNDVKIDEDKSPISSFSLLQPPSYSEFKNMQAFGFDPSNMNPYSMSSSCYIGVPGSSRSEPTNLYSHEYYSADSGQDDNKQRKKPRIHHAI